MQLNHTIIWCHDKVESAAFLTRILGLPPARPFLHFMVVALDNNISVDFMEKTGDIAIQHYAFLGSESEFDDSFARIKAEGLQYWADPARSKPAEINHHFGGRGLYFEDPNGHLFEIITPSYDSEVDV